MQRGEKKKPKYYFLLVGVYRVRPRGLFRQRQSRGGLLPSGPQVLSCGGGVIHSLQVARLGNRVASCSWRAGG